METKTFWPRPQCAGGIWKRRFHSENASNVFRTHYAGGIWKRNRSFWICVWEKLGQGKSHDDRDASFSKSPVFKMFTVHTKTFSNSLRFEERSRKAPLSWRISVDGRPNCEIKLRFQILPRRMDAVLNSFHVIKQEWIYRKLNVTIVCFLAFSIPTLGSICMHFYSSSFWLASVTAYMYVIRVDSDYFSAQIRSF